MHHDVTELRDFYLTPLGRVARHITSSEIRSVWPSARTDRVLGLGHTTPYLRPFLAEAERVVAVMPASEGILHWPPEGPNVTALAFEDRLPLPDNSIDKLLMVHLLEATRDPVSVLREAWRVLVPAGRILVVVPHRTGAWARADHTPFGLGRPYSSLQLTRLLADASMEPLQTRRFLCVPPSRRRLILRSTRGWERVGRQLWPRFSGVIAVEAEKVMVRGIPVAKKEFSLRVAVPGLAPVPKPATCAITCEAKTPPAPPEGSRTTTAH
ncbi:MAG: class I SAM-dependent methyltransferase [Pseudomonadota bacterium]